MIEALQKCYGDESLISGFVASRAVHAYPLSRTVKAVPGSLIDQYIP